MCHFQSKICWFWLNICKGLSKYCLFFTTWGWLHRSLRSHILGGMYPPSPESMPVCESILNCSCREINVVFFPGVHIGLILCRISFLALIANISAWIGTTPASVLKCIVRDTVLCKRHNYDGKEFQRNKKLCLESIKFVFIGDLVELLVCRK